MVWYAWYGSPRAEEPCGCHSPPWRFLLLLPIPCRQYHHHHPEYHHHHPQYLQRISLLVATIITITVNCPPHVSHKQDIISTFSMTVMFVNTASEWKGLELAKQKVDLPLYYHQEIRNMLWDFPFLRLPLCAFACATGQRTIRLGNFSRKCHIWFSLFWVLPVLDNKMLQ